ncbi:MAG: Zn-dependent hydrolase [Spirochaetota bacterium]
MINMPRLQKDLAELSEIGRMPTGGISRPAFSPEEIEARKWFIDKLRKAELCPSVDPAGNITGKLEGKGPVVICGSHLDSIENGGMFDGAVGVVAGMECLRVIKENNMKHTHPIEVISFTDEEERFLGFLGSLALTGKLGSKQAFEIMDCRGIYLKDAMAAAGLDVKNISGAARGPGRIKAFVELHIEQGPVLESLGCSVGIVEVIMGNYRYGVNIRGRQDHAGFPLKGRKDPMKAALNIMNEMWEEANRMGKDKTLVTIGCVEVKPGLGNVIPGRVYFNVDFRDHRKQVLEEVGKMLNDKSQSFSQQLGVDPTISTLLKAEPLFTPSSVLGAAEKAAGKLKVRWHRMSSGAGHDAQVMGTRVPAGLIFVPSVNGRSHCPQEKTRWEDIQDGANVLLEMLLDLSK